MRKDKKIAIRLREQGKTYNEIAKKLEIAKGTLSYWFRDKDFENIKKEIYKKSQRKWSDNISKYNKQRSKQIWQERREAQNKAKLEIKNLSNKELKLVGTALYWAEGYKKTKWCISFCNSDPMMIKLMMNFFRNICKVPKNKFRLRLQIYPNLQAIEIKKFWSKITNIPLSQFKKTYISTSKSSKLKRSKNTLPYGTLHIIIFDKNLVDKIKGWILGLKNIS